MSALKSDLRVHSVAAKCDYETAECQKWGLDGAVVKVVG